MTQDTSGFFAQHQTEDVPRDQYGRYELPDPHTGEETDGWTRATTFAATLAESYGLRIWKERQVVWGLSRRPDLITMASTISGPEDKKALGAIVDEAHIAAGTDAKANRGTAIHRACQAAERGDYAAVPEELRPHVANYFAELKKHNLTMLPDYVERTIIVDRYHVGGTLDNVFLCPDGKYRIGDKKTGSLDYADIEFAVQLSLYAHADAVYNYDKRQYEPMPEIATDYAIIAHIDPTSGACELHRVNIEWGWLWARTCAEVMDIRKTKHVITPYVPETVVPSTVFTPGSVAFDGLPAAHALPENVTTFAQNTSQHINNGNAQGYPARVPDEDRYAAFWAQPDEADDDASGAEVNGVPLAQYGQSNTHGCARGETCEFTGQDGLHQDGTVCLYGNARSVPIDTQGHPTAESVAEVPPAAPVEQDTVPDDAMVARILKASKTKAEVQTITRKLMEALGIKESDPDGIRLNQYKEKLANQTVTLAFRRQVEVPGFGQPSGPGNGDVASGKQAATKKAGGDAAADEVTKEHDAAVRTAVASIRTAGSIDTLTKLHDYYANDTRIGWTEEMQSAARTRALELDSDAGQSPLTPEQQIDGATSLETLTRVYQQVTNNGQNPSAWTAQLNDRAQAKHADLQRQTVATSVNE